MLLFIIPVDFQETRIDQKCCWSWHDSITNLIFLHLYLLHFTFNLCLDSFILEAYCLFLNAPKFLFHIGVEVLIDQMWQNLLYCWFILIFQIDLLGSNVFDLVYQVVIWRWHLFECFSDGKVFDFSFRLENW